MARVHLGKLVSPVVLWGGTGVTKVIQCQEEEKEELWVWDRRALETLRYSDSERQVNMVNFDGGWYAWGEKRSEEIEQQVGKGIFKKQEAVQVKVLVEGLNLEKGFLRPTFTLLTEVIEKGKERDGIENKNGINFWHEDARVMLALLEEEPPRRGFHYSSVLPDHGWILSILVVDYDILQESGGGWMRRLSSGRK